VENLLRFLIARGITRVNLNGFRPVGRGRWREELAVDRLAAQPALQRISDNGFSTKIAPSDLAISPLQTHCGVGHFLNIMPDGDVFPCHVLTNPEFRCGNVREQSLTEICRRGGLLGALADLDFRELAMQEARVSTLTRQGICLGTVYKETGLLSIWPRHLPLVQIHGST
jgi:MoaA/NifB/PqqE/SkfB family radical SAM enzyme